MKKMPCLFVRTFDGPGSATITTVVTPGCEWVLAGDGVASRKHDGTACLVEGGSLFKRYDFKARAREKGGAPPSGFVPCQPDPDETTGHWPGWLPVLADDPASKWHAQAWERERHLVTDGTYELCGPHFQANPQRLEQDSFIRHGIVLVDCPRDFGGLRHWLAEADMEGVVFAHDDGRRAKIRRGDFGYAWPVKP